MDRRDFVKSASILGAASVLPKYSMAQVRGSDRLKVALIGCGGRGNGAVRDLFEADSNTQLIAIADLFEDKLALAEKQTLDFLDRKFKDQKSDMYKVTNETKFFGFDAYKKIMQTDADIVILATPAIFRAEQMRAAIMAKKHVFAEKPFATDIITLRKMYELIPLAESMNVSVISGTQRRYDEGYQESKKRVEDGQIGDIIAMDCAWLSPYYAGAPVRDEQLDIDEVEYQLRNFHCFIWSSGDSIVDQMIHNVDVCRWFYGEDKKPEKVIGYGGRNINYPVGKYGNRFSHFTVDYDYANGVHLCAKGRQEANTSYGIYERIVGTKGVLTMSLHPKSNTIVGEKPWAFDRKNETMRCESREHLFLITAIREGKCVNTIKTMLDSNLMMITGRQAAYSGKEFKYDWTFVKSQERLVPDVVAFGKKPIDPVPNAENYQLM